MTNLVFPDTTVLCNFAAVDRIDLLTDWLRDRGRWCEAVWAETRKSAGHWPNLNPLLKDGGPLGAPIEINDSSVIHRVDRVRVSVFGGAPDDPLKHLGEAQTCVLLAEHGEFYGSWWITEDNDAYEYAVRRRITTLRTRDVMARLVTDGDITASAAFALLDAMSQAGRYLSLPTSPQELLR